MSFNQFVMREQYLKVKGLGDRLELMKQMIDWKPFVQIVKQVFHDNKIEGGRPHSNELVIVRALLLQGWYGLSDPELEFQVNDRLSFRNFLGFPESVPDFTTVWKVRERLKEAGIDKRIWNELQRQLERKGYVVKTGVIQDASFIEADLGRKRHYKEQKAEKKGEIAQAHILHNLGYREFKCRGMKSCENELNLVSIAYNLKKIHNKIRNGIRKVCEEVKKQDFFNLV